MKQNSMYPTIQSENESAPAMITPTAELSALSSVRYEEAFASPERKPHHCCCKESMLKALKLLCDTDLSRFIDFKKFAFLTPSFLVGSKYVVLDPGSDTKDNLAELSGEFKRFTAGNCDLIDIHGIAVCNFPLLFSLTEQVEHLTELLTRIIQILKKSELSGSLVAVLEELLEALKIGDFSEALVKAIIDFLTDWFTTLPEVTSVSLCQLEAVAFEAKDSGTSNKANFRCAKEYLQARLGNVRPKCGECSCHCNCDDCCCNSGIIHELLTSNASRTVTLTAGGLTLQEARILGAVGSILVLANEEDERFYFVCADKVQFLG